MEFYEDSKTSSDESDKQELMVNDDVGIGRSYECVFCKRGFTTAQALGGHMNIHRRDRARNKQPATHQLPVEDYGRSAGFLHSISSQSSFYSQSMETHKNYRHHQMYVTRPIPSNANHHNRCYINSDDHDHDQSLHFQRPPPFSLFHEDNWSTSLSLRIGTPTYLEDKQDGRKEFNKEDELDLELRLGHDP